MTIIQKGEPMSDTISKKGVFIPDITVEMFRNASLESIEDLMASGEMEDILLPPAQPERMTENREECGMTNFEWMTHDERFVAFWLSEIGCDTCPAFTYCKKRSETVDESCVETLCNWLKCDFKREQIGAEIYKI